MKPLSKTSIFIGQKVTSKIWKNRSNDVNNGVPTSFLRARNDIDREHFALFNIKAICNTVKCVTQLEDLWDTFSSQSSVK